MMLMLKLKRSDIQTFEACVTLNLENKSKRKNVLFYLHFSLRKG